MKYCVHGSAYCLLDCGKKIVVHCMAPQQVTRVSTKCICMGGEADLGHFVTLGAVWEVPLRSLVLNHKATELAAFMGHLQLLR